MYNLSMYDIWIMYIIMTSMIVAPYNPPLAWRSSINLMDLIRSSASMILADPRSPGLNAVPGTRLSARD